ncbi:MAG: anaerobic ribonucleoside-triphosphate reductase activating protein [Deltaproteobacteria bacterium]|nr:anaerobic ribonucleoside-triphosphate reductase activating protein [Deltaproteobacteria bacterium]MBW2018253.1 anaerobic ribonucleoside-triphosphate reductase activating protein [Deltaproteobacteria bacterium]MBW2130651.1 anaerobic ribonucleoside-triphosphate reductase activating protein [Deltaproteobacteria bacterium]MBW2304673.1 anaerobic ribonucleoside-triphosphate reductase activating protein [Deltaproteobacteria bacterium]
MVIGGLQKNSFIDFPGRISCVLFLKGCNFRCPYCHNPELVLGTFQGTQSFDQKQVLDLLQARSGFLEGVVITGGEPTLQPDLLSLCKTIRALGYPVKLDTNGSRPDVLEDLFSHGAVDYVAMDIKTDPRRYHGLTPEPLDPTTILTSIRIIMTSGVPYEFRTTCVKPFVDGGIVRKIGKSIEGAARYALQTFHQAKCILNPDFFVSQNGAGYSREEMERLKAIAEPWVEECILR